MDYGVFDLVVVGAGITGLTVARAYVEKQPEAKVLLVDKRPHLGGNCHDFLHGSGVYVQTYGPHIFHTKSERVRDFILRFCELNAYRHKVVAMYKGGIYPIPINRNTINKFFGLSLRTEEEVRDFLKGKRIDVQDMSSSRDVVVSRFGVELYEAFVKHYSKKQWDVYPDQMPPSILERLPIRYDGNDYYYDAIFEGLPKEGFSKLFESMADHGSITVSLGSDYFDIKDRLPEGQKTVYTGRLDEFFGFSLGRLPYRHSRFIFEIKDTGDFQPNSVVNYTEPSPDYIRVTEFKKLYLQESKESPICIEYTSDEGVPTYPFPSEEGKSLAKRYIELAPDGVFFAGRLGLHKYLDMDAAVLEALSLCDDL